MHERHTFPKHERIKSSAQFRLAYDKGRRVVRYDKIHLFDVDIPGRDEGYRESANAVPGREPVVVPPARAQGTRSLRS